MSLCRIVVFVTFISSFISFITVKAENENKHLTKGEGEPKFIDVFSPGLNGKPSFGTPAAMCWSHGGVCVHIRDCHSRNMKFSVAGCRRGYQVCCIIIKPGHPSIGPKRKSNDLTDDSSNFDESLEKELQMLSIINANIMRRNLE
ncbi:hypothetical protein ACJJTC_010084 [Scirpophaga incertulas]